MFLLYFRKSTCTTYRETSGSCILNALWFIMCGHCTTNILLSKICLLFFTMFLGGGGTHAVGAGGPASDPCGVLYGKHQRRGRRRVRRRRIFIQPLKWSIDPNADMPLYSVPSSYLLSTAPESIKLNNVPLIIPNLLLKYEYDMILILLKHITFNWSANVPTLLLKKHVHHI